MTPAKNHDEAHIQRLRAAGLRPTRPRIALSRLLLGGPQRHVSAQDVVREAHEAGEQMAQATVYNALADFVSAGLLRQVELPARGTLYDTHTAPHGHVLHVETGAVRDLVLPSGSDLPLAPGEQLVDLVIRVR